MRRRRGGSLRRCLAGAFRDQVWPDLRCARLSRERWRFNHARLRPPLAIPSRRDRCRGSVQHQQVFHVGEFLDPGEHEHLSIVRQQLPHGEVRCRSSSWTRKRRKPASIVSFSSPTMEAASVVPCHSCVHNTVAAASNTCTRAGAELHDHSLVSKDLGQHVRGWRRHSDLSPRVHPSSSAVRPYGRMTSGNRTSTAAPQSGTLGQEPPQFRMLSISCGSAVRSQRAGMLMASADRHDVR